MPRRIDTHPVRTQLIATIGSVAIMTLLMWLFDSGPLIRDIPAIVGTGLGVFLVTVYLRRKSRDGGEKK
jgi:hypothetical protein